MRTNIDQLLADIDAVVPPESLDVVQEVSGIIRPQLELIVALSGLEEVVNRDPNIDVHHFFWPRREFKTGLQKQFRRLFTVPIIKGVHSSLHSELEPPQMPSRVTMLAYLSLIDQKEVLKDREEHATASASQ